MYSNGVRDYDREGKEIQTGLFAGKVTRDAEVRTTGSGKQYCTTSVRAFTRKDGTAAFLTVKAWGGDMIARMQTLRKGDSILAAGRLDVREYNGKTYTDLIPDFLLVSGQGGTQGAAGGIAPPAYQEISEEEQDGELPFKEGLRLPITKGEIKNCNISKRIIERNRGRTGILLGNHRAFPAGPAKKEKAPLLPPLPFPL